MSVNQAAYFNCSPPESSPLAVVWMVCPQSAQNGNGSCEIIKHLSTEGFQSIIDVVINSLVTPELYQLIILIGDDLHLLDELNNSLIYCQALYEGSKPLNSSQARFLVQGQLRSNYKEVCTHTWLCIVPAISREINM